MSKITTEEIKDYFKNKDKERELEFIKYLDNIIYRKEYKKVLDRISYKDMVAYLLLHNINNLLDCIPEEILNSYVRDKKIKKIVK